jgi:2-C-methyl-D-erythritol 4-phosphate cytidylyltransferase
MILGGQPVVARTINTFYEALPGAEIVVVLPEEHIPLWRNLTARFEVAPHRCVCGGKERFDSVRNGIKALSEEVEYIAIHDGVRALVSKRLIVGTMLEVEKYDAVIPVIDAVDSYRIVERNESKVISRSQLRIVQTPQVFRSDILRRAYEQEFDARFTDDATVVESLGVTIHLFKGERSNIKLTNPEDMIYAEALLRQE